MIGHYLLTLTAEQEDRVLTHRFRPYSLRLIVTQNYTELGPCLLDIAHDFGCGGSLKWEVVQRAIGHLCRWRSQTTVGDSYDAAARRFGEIRVNAAIRNRILANRARRILWQPVEHAAV